MTEIYRQDIIGRLQHLYMQMLSEDRMPDIGLCDVIEGSVGLRIRNLFSAIVRPTYDDKFMLKMVGHNTAFWGSEDYSPLNYHFTPLRQTLLLLFIEYLKGETDIQ